MASLAPRAVHAPDATDVAALLEGIRLADDGVRGRVALTFYKGKGREGRQTYGELADAVARAAGHLRDALGVARGDRVAILAPNRLSVPTLVLAIMRLGAVVVPLNPNSGPQDWSYVLGHSGAKGIFTTRELGARLGDELEVANLFHAHLEDLPLAPGAHEASGASADVEADLANEPAIVLYTSGTTGSPKGVVLSHRNVLAQARAMAHNFALDGTTQFAVLPLYHAHAFGFGLMTSLVSGGHLVFTEKLDPFAWADVIRAEEATYASVVPNLLPVLLSTRVSAAKVPSLRRLLVSSAPLTTRSAREFEAATGIRLVQGWGLSEFSNFACCMPTDLDDAAHEALLYGADVPSVGPPLAGFEVAVMDDLGTELHDGERGELCVRGACAMLGYYRDPETTSRTFREGWLRTGDEGFARVVDERRVFHVAGRLKEIIIRGGEKYSPLAIERKLSAAVPGIEGRFVVLGFPHDAQGEEIGAYVEREVATPEVRAALVAAASALPAESRPKVILVGDAPIPRTFTGKIQRRKLEPVFEGYRAQRGPVVVADIP